MITHKAKKSLGQNFLKSESALQAIIEAGEISSDDVILEIGPGKGALTKKLLEESNHVVAVEKDHDLFEFLKEKFSKEIAEKKLILLNEDILEIKPSADFLLWGVSQADGPKGSAVPAGTDSDPKKEESKEGQHNYKIIANIPYNITGAILKKFLTEKNPSGIGPRASQPKMMVLMVQNEVAKRIVARDQKESILSISVKAYGEPKMIMKVPARYFSPAPKVDSAVIVIKNISRKILVENKVNEEKFWEIVHAGFAHKRKKLSNNLKKVIKNIPEKWKDKRAEDLRLEDWIFLAKN